MGSILVKKVLSGVGVVTTTTGPVSPSNEESINQANPFSVHPLPEAFLPILEGAPRSSLGPVQGRTAVVPQAHQSADKNNCLQFKWTIAVQS